MSEEIWTQKDIDELKPDEDGKYHFPEKTTFDGWIKFKNDSIFGYGCHFGNGCKFGTDGKNYGIVENHDCGCRFGADCVFGRSCHFDEGCKFGHGCSFDDYCEFKSGAEFGAWCRFGMKCEFGFLATFGNECIFPASYRNGKLEIVGKFGHSCRFTMEMEQNKGDEK